jgi:hypothetical protein
MVRGKSARGHNDTAVWVARECGDSLLELSRVLCTQDTQLDAHWRHGLDGSELADSRGHTRVSDDRRPGYPGRHFLEQLQPFCRDSILEDGKTGRVTAGPPQT